MTIVFIKLKDGSAENYPIIKLEFEDGNVRIETSNKGVLLFDMGDIKELEILAPHKEN